LVRTVGGQLTVQNFKVTGLAGNPDVAGDVDWKKGRLALASFGDYREIDLETRVSRERIAIDRLSVRAGSGGFAMDPAVATRQSTGVWTFASTGSATRFPIVTDDQLLAIVNLKYALEGEVSETMIDLKRVDVARMDVELPEVKRRNVQNLERPTDIVLMRQGRVVAGKRKLGPSTAQAPTRTYRANLSAPRNVWVRSSDVNLELGLSDGFRIEYVDSMQLFGEARVLGGRIDVIGREFKVARNTGQDADATVRFAGAAKQPYVNVSALHVNERENVKVTVNVVGRGTDVQIKVSSDPAMSESEIYALLATGRRDLRRSSGSSITADQAVSVVGSFAANQLKNVLIKRLPIDLFDTISVEAGAEGLETARVELGKYLSDSLYLGYTLQAGANEARGESQHTGRLEYQVSKGVSFEFTAGSAFSVGADLVFSVDK
jgi:translocation and assembly module TamB